MIDTLMLYKMIKPQDRPNLYTGYDLIIGGTGSVKNLNKGLWVLNLLNSKVLTKGEKILTSEGERHFEIQKSIVSTSYQLDFYKEFNNTLDTAMVVQNEALRMREWLGGFEVAQYLKELGGEMLPILSDIIFTTSLSETKAVLNRASFDFEVVSYQEIRIEVKTAKQIQINIGETICRNS